MKKNSIFEYCLLPPPYGGITVYVKRLCEQLSKDDFTVGGLYTNEFTDSDFLLLGKFYKDESLSESSKISKAIAHIKRLFRYNHFMSEFELIHYHGLENLKFLLFQQKAKQKKLIITVHSAMIESFYRRTDRLNKWCMKKLAESDTHWIAVSEQAKECMLRLPFKFKNEIDVVPAYIPTKKEFTHPLPNAILEYVDNHDKVLAFYARSFMLNDGEDVYGFDTILRLYSKIATSLPNKVGLVFCLSDTSEHTKIDELHRKAMKLSIDDKICWQIGALDNISLLWDITDVYIRPTSTDGDSVAVREVLDHGTQVVASDVCPRPKGVICYRFSDEDELLNKVINALKAGKKAPSENYEFYNKVKQIVESAYED